MTAPAATKRFRNQCDTDPVSVAAQASRDAHWAVFAAYATPGCDVGDVDREIDRIVASSGWKKQFVRRALFGFARLQDLPRLRELQEATRLLDVEHLAAVNNALEELGPDIPQEMYDRFDAILVGIFTPKRDQQKMPHTKTITVRIRELIKRIDPSRAYDPEKRKKRLVDTDDKVLFDELSLGGEMKARIEILTNAVSSARARANITQLARERGISLVDAAMGLLSGEIQPATKVVMHVFAPKDRNAGDPVFLPGYGWTNPDDTVEFDRLLGTAELKTVDLDEAANATTACYSPTDAMRAAVIARDGTCIYPGCTVSAHRCQLDHRIPFDEGGRTTVSNLFALCSKHHNMKTDRRAFYFPDPSTGDIVWCFADGTYEIVEPSGVLFSQITPTCPRWQSSLRNARANRERMAEFNAKAHTILDQFDQDLDLMKAEVALLMLEEEYGLSFPIRPKLPYEEPLPDEPVDPPYPDPEDELSFDDDTDLSQAERYRVAGDKCRESTVRPPRPQ